MYSLLEKDGRKSGLECKGCGLYFHKICLNLPTEHFKFLLEANEYTCQARKNFHQNFSYNPPVVSKDCLARLKTHKSKVIVSCFSCINSFHRACISNLKISKKELNNSTWMCMNCCFPISQLDDSHFDDTFNGCYSIDLPFLPYDTSYEFPKLNTGLKIGHLKINGLFGKLDSLSFLIHSLNLDVLFISETHLNINQEYPGLLIDGYDFLRKDRNRIWGGIGCFYKDSIRVNIFGTPNF
jgi:hypothetical protein